VVLELHFLHFFWILNNLYAHYRMMSHGHSHGDKFGLSADGTALQLAQPQTQSGSVDNLSEIPPEIAAEMRRMIAELKVGQRRNTLFYILMMLR